MFRVKLLHFMELSVQGGDCKSKIEYIYSFMFVLSQN